MNVHTVILSLKGSRGRAAENSQMVNHILNITLVLALFAVLLLGIRPLAAQIDPNIKKAAGQINEITPLKKRALSGNAQGSDDESGRAIPYSAILDVCAEFEQISPPLPPVERLVVGTFDAQSGEFTWGPTVYFGLHPIRFVDAVLGKIDLRPVYDQLRIDPLVVNLSPRITSLPVGYKMAPVFRRTSTRRVQRSLRQGAVAPTAAVRARPRGNDDTLGGHPGGLSAAFLPVRAGTVDLVFKVVNLPANRTFAVTIEGRTATSKRKATSVDIVVPPRVMVTFRVGSGSTSFTEELWFDRPPILGCFTLEALPITFVYEPPGSGSSQTYTTIEQVGTVVKTLSSRESSTTRPVRTPFSTVNDFINVLRGVGGLVSKADPEVGGAVKTAGDILEAAWGKSETNETISHTVTEEKTLSIQVTRKSAIVTSAHLGPGRGDIIHYLVKPVFAWLATQNYRSKELFLTVSLLGYKATAALSAEDLRIGTLSEPSRQAQNLLLVADPLTPEYRQSRSPFGFRKVLKWPRSTASVQDAPAHGNPAPDRLVPAFPFEYHFAGGRREEVFKHTIEESDLTAETTIHTRTTTEVGGFLSYVATNVPQTGETSLSTTQGASEQTTVSSTVEVKVVFESQVGEGHIVQVYYDKIYGTFAFQEVDPSATSVSGVVSDQANRPVPNQEVSIELADGRVLVTHTDSQGRYRFRSRLLKPGRLVVAVGNQKIPFDFRGRSISNLRVRLGGKLIKTRPIGRSRPKPKG